MVKNSTKERICNSWILDSPRRMNSVTNVKFLLIISFVRYWPLHLYWITIKWKIDIAMSLMTFSSISFPFSFLLLCFDSCSFSVSTISTWQWNLVVFKASLSFLTWLSPLFFISLFFISLLIVLLSLFCLYPLSPSLSLSWSLCLKKVLYVRPFATHGL